MTRRPLFWKIYPYYFVVILLALLLAALYGASEMRALYTNQVTTTLEARAKIAIRLLAPLISRGDNQALERECQQLAALSNTRITVIDLQGVVLGDSHEDWQSMENHGSRPEIVEALAGRVGVTTRYSNTLQTSLMYVAIPITTAGQMTAVVRAAVPVLAVEETLTSFYWNIAIVAVIILLVAALVSVMLIRRLTIPLGQLRDGAMRFAQGNFDAALPLPDIEEISDLSESMNRMASEIDRRIRTIATQRNEREAILSSMSEGLLALDSHDVIVSLNSVAAKFLSLPADATVGRSIYETVRIPRILELIERAKQQDDTTEMEIELPGTPQKFLQVHAATLKSDSSERAGTVLVLNDITRLKRLERIRRDFVANVSHELKTPITAITGSVETLATAEPMSGEDRTKFLRIISRHAERLNSLVDDLLSLARLEREAESDDQTRVCSSVADLLQAAVQAVEHLALKSNIIIALSCPPALMVNVNRVHVEQAVTNLIDNAIKYSEAGATVHVAAIQEGDRVTISVRDTGVGIASEHLGRLFERFYRVDQARSRAEGGTGLGLAIVKHVAAVHGGTVRVESKPGLGSTFVIQLPRSQ